MPCKWLRGNAADRFYCAVEGDERDKRFDLGCLENDEWDCYEEAEPAAKEEKDAN